MKRALKKVRDSVLLLPVLVAGLRLARAMGWLRSRKIYSHVPYRGTVRVDCGNGRSFRIQSQGHNIENGLYWDGLFAHEPQSMRLWVERAANANVVLDVGANSGVFALAAAAAGGATVHAFEPLPRVHQILHRNIGLNPGFPVNAWPCAVGEKDGTATIFDPGGDAPTSASLSKDFVSGKFGDIPGFKIKVRSIDSFCRELAITEVGLIKVDVEGYEAHALRGMQETVASSRPDILLEVLSGQEAALRRLVDELWPGLYEWMPIDEGGAHVSRNVLLSAQRIRSGSSM